MGLDDRDYMRDRNRRIFDRETSRQRPFMPPRESSTLYIVLFWLAIALATYKAFGWWQEKQQRTRAEKHAALATIANVLRGRPSKNR